MSSTSSSMPGIKRNKVYWFDSGDLYLLVEDDQFKVHSYFFERESEIFRERIAPKSEGEARQGSSQDNIIRLKDVTVQAFEKFLWTFYNPDYSIYTASIEDWTMILDLAHEWKFARMKALAVREIEKLELDDVDRIVLYHRFKVEKEISLNWVTKVCARGMPLTIQEGLKLGNPLSIRIAQAREMARARPLNSGGQSPLPSDLPEGALVQIVSELFSTAETSSKKKNDSKQNKINGTVEKQSGNADGGSNSKSNGTAK